jgi:alpha-D-ribose 1-methylphosphonate 5-triphosphate synthase subunit PhnH
MDCSISFETNQPIIREQMIFREAMKASEEPSSPRRFRTETFLGENLSG